MSRRRDFLVDLLLIALTCAGLGAAGFIALQGGLHLPTNPPSESAR